uniref:Knottin scorpion toxin-like domain-containing protein n=1 Tax=Oryza punctata TaxID=4537 RepID=A0A0E0K7T7_ORYPU
MGRRYTNISSLMPPLLLIILVVAAASTVARSAWVLDYASNHGCGETAAAELCDPGDPAANRACNDACHYNGCRGGRCILLYRGYLDGGDGDSSGGGGGGRGIGRGCHCRGGYVRVR